MSKTIYIGGRLESKEKGNVVAGANAILDDTKGKMQNVINKETDDELARLEQSKQDNLNFDNAPTEDSTNPVTSGGVYTAEKALSDAIEAILLLIPSAATALNKLVDTNTMNSSISTATATFRGTYNAVSDLGLTYQATHAQIEAALDALGLTADNNDFAFVQIPVSDQSQDIAKTERFKFNDTNWLYEYDLNTSGFTATQWSAINSGITVALVTKLTDLPTAAALQLALNGKQDTLTFDNEPTALSQNPVTSGGIYTAIQAVVTVLGGRLDTLEGLIPSEASSSNKLTDKAYVDGLVQAITELIPAEADTTNQLADKAYVLAQILAATPAFKGQFTTLAELQAVASPKAGDLGIVRTKDSDGMDVFTVYQYLSNAWNVFYSLSYHPQTKPATTGTTGDYPYNGMGRMELAKNMVNTGTELAPVMVNQLTQDMFYKGAVGSRVPNTNTIFVIRYDYVLGEDITVPANCVLEFDGGSISGAHTITGNNTGIHSNSNSIFGDNITISGTWNIPVVYGDWIENVRNANNLRKAVALLSSGNKLVVGTGVHNLSLTQGDSTGIDLPDNTELQIEGEIKANTNNLSSYMIISPGENCYIHGGKITGDKDTSEATEGEYGHGITIWRENVKIESVEISNCWGDGVCTYRKCTVEECIIHDCRRQGISICYGDETKILRNNIYNIGGTAPQSCIDVEPNDENHPISGIEISGNYLHDSQGAGVFLNGMNGTVEDVKVINNVFEGCGMTITAAKHVVISNNIIKYINIANIQKSDGVIFESNMYIPNLTESYSKALNLDYDNKDIVLNNNIFNYNIPSAIDLKNCIFTNNKLIKAKLTVRNGVVARNNYINGEINVYTDEDGDASYVCNNTFFVKGEGELFAFMTYSAATGSFYFCNNEVTIDYDVLRAFYYGDARYLDSQLFSVFVEKDNNYNVPQYTTFYNLKYTKGVRTNNFDVRQKRYYDYFNDLKLNVEDYGVIKRVYDGINSTVESVNADGFTYALNRGTTTQRPTSSLTTDDEGFRYFDTTLHKPIWYRGNGTWVDATGAQV